MILVKHFNKGAYKPYFYFALEDYILSEVLKPGETYFFTWEIKGVVIGKNQVIENEVNLDYLRENNIELFRRPTGGGTVYADAENTMFSIITKKNENFSFKNELVPIIEAVGKLGVTLEFSGRNDILFDGRKVSGNAFLQNKYGMLLHGTILYNCNLETMVRAITPSDEKLVSKGISSVRSRVVNLKPYLNGMAQHELVQHLEDSLTDKIYVLSDTEIKMLEKRAEKYATKEWIYRQQATYTKSLRKRIGGGLFDIQLTLQEGVIKDLQITGDFFDQRPIGELVNNLLGVVYNRENLEAALSKIDLGMFFLDLDVNAFKELLFSGIIEV